ncbi:MAG: aminotransferase class III-fold pyridoxal phosphate-dependent enzyme [Candidatus Gracilibacteria bacterium]|jgi:acetylornithine/succinyldiaminopimelate/putrescine aminotransferase
MSNQEDAKKYLIQTYAQYPIELKKGKGVYVWDSKGKKYLDFYGGHAVCLLGHCPPQIVKAISSQANQLIFYSNVFSTEPAIILAKLLANTLKPKEYKIYFTNSGSEANETALKIVRKHTGKNHIISFKNAFHGRGTSPLAVTGIDSYHKYNPNLDQYTSFAELGNMESVKSVYNNDTAAIICEPIQSIGGINMAAPKFYKDLAAFCAEKKILLIFDEIQTGLGRTGKLWFAQGVGIYPDIITVAKGIAGGLPLSAVIVKKEISENIKVGDHATTFGGGPVPCAAGIATIKTLLKKGFLTSVRKKEQMIKEALKNNPKVKKIHGKGLLIGIELDKEYPNFVSECIKQGVIISSSSNKKVIRIMPPLIITPADIKKFASIFNKMLSKQ